MTDGELLQLCCDLKPFLKTINIIIEIIRWSVPLILIFLGTIDMVKLTVSDNDSKAVKDVYTKFFYRILYGLLVFLVPLAIDIVFSLLNQFYQDNSGYTSSTAWLTCWNKVEKETLNCDN